MNHLFNEDFNLLDFLKSYYRQNLLVGAVEAGWPTESVGRSLIMWIAWILFNNGTSHPHRVPVASNWRLTRRDRTFRNARRGR